MIEIYRDTTERVYLTLYQGSNPVDADVNPSVVITDVTAGDVLFTGVATREALGVYYVVPPSQESSKMLRIDWTYTIGGEANSPSQYVSIVTPYALPDEIRSFAPGMESADIDDLKEVERTVRGVIDAYCHQTFDYERGKTYQAYGRNAATLVLPKRLIRLTSVYQGLTNLSNYVQAHPGSHYTLGRTYPANAIKADVNDLFTSRRFFSENTAFSVTGDWGWEYVPSEVNQAAKLIIKARFCDEDAYRERWIDNIRNADWRMEFLRTGNHTTGSADADALLNMYRNLNWQVL